MSAVSADDRLRWDAVYAARGVADVEPAVPADFRAAEHRFPTTGRALDLACGRGGAAVWLARRGLAVWGLDVSAVAIDQARARAAQWQVAHRCRFDVVDLDHGLPPGPPVDVVICHRFRAPDLTDAVIDRLAAAGIDMEDVAGVLETEGVASFAASFDDLMASLQDKAAELAG